MHVATSLVVAPLRHAGWRAEGILGVSRLDFEHDMTSVGTGRPVAGGPDGEGEFSLMYGAALVREGLGAERLGVRLEWRHAGMDGNVTPCPAEWYCPPQWGAFDIDEMRLGVSWRL
jgi:hypothetical protein